MKKLIALTLAILMVFGLVACGNSSAPAADAPGDAPAANAPAANAPAEKQKMTAMFLGSISEKAIVDIIQNAVDEFNATNEYNVEFSFETYESEDYKTKQATLMASNASPDVFFSWSAGYLQPFVEGGKVYEIGKLLEQDAEWSGRFGDGVFGPVSFNGGIYAVPHGQTVAVMFYNTEMFAQYGVEVPKTYADFVAACQTFVDNGVTPISAPVQDAWIAGQLLQQIANCVGGIDLYNGTVDGTAAWNDARYVEAGNKLAELVNMGAFPDGFLGMTNDEGRNLFTQGETAMYYMGSWDIAVLQQSTIGDKVGVFNIPAVDSSLGNVALADIDQALAISANCSNPEAAAAFIKYFSDTAAQEAYAYNANYLLSTTTQLDESKLSPLFLEVNSLSKELTGMTPWLDRVFGAGEGVEFNNVAQAIMAGKDVQEQFDNLQKYAENNK